MFYKFKSNNICFNVYHALMIGSHILALPNGVLKVVTLLLL